MIVAIMGYRLIAMTVSLRYIQSNPCKLCNGIDDDCDGQRDNSLPMETCSSACVSAGFDYNASRVANARCCGNDAGEGSPYQLGEAGFCGDGNDNDCDGLIDGADLLDCPPSCTDNDGDYHISEGTPINLCNLNASIRYCESFDKSRIVEGNYELQ